MLFKHISIGTVRELDELLFGREDSVQYFKYSCKGSHETFSEKIFGLSRRAPKKDKYISDENVSNTRTKKGKQGKM